LQFKVIAGNKKACPAAGQGFLQNDIVILLLQASLPAFSTTTGA
jgi:hypothetical protein